MSVESSECPVCKQRTTPLRNVYYCEECNVPILTETCPICQEKATKVSRDIRPVFPEERLLVEILWNEPLKYVNDSVWSVSGGAYLINGKRKYLKINELRYKDVKEIKKQYKKFSTENSYESFEKYVKVFVENNKKHFEYMTTEAMQYIQNISKDYDMMSRFVSFSGGKDSTVVSDLVVKALGTTKVVHIFGDTTLEFPFTQQYVSRFKEKNRLMPFFVAKNKDKNFYQLCETIGPPSRLMRWCCTVFKTGAITKQINTLFKNKKHILTYYGIRRSESTSRSKYERDSDSPKISIQRTISPIIDWYDVDIWLYLLTTKVDFNEAYCLGFTRVGCWCCPNNSEWSEFLSKVFMTEQFIDWHNLLVRNAIKIGKPDPEEYVAGGWWKKKQGGNGIDYAKNTHISFVECVNEKDTFNYELNKPITEDLYEFFKPFGTLNFELGNKRLNEVFVLDKSKNSILKLSGRKNQNILKVTILKFPIANAKNIRNAESKIRCQLTKYQSCLNCTGCISVCRFNAISIQEKKGVIKYTIDERKCTHCGECVDHFPHGCYISKVLVTAAERENK